MGHFFTGETGGGITSLPHQLGIWVPRMCFPILLPACKAEGTPGTAPSITLRAWHATPGHHKGGRGRVKEPAPAAQHRWGCLHGHTSTPTNALNRPFLRESHPANGLHVPCLFLFPVSFSHLGHSHAWAMQRNLGRVSAEFGTASCYTVSEAFSWAWHHVLVWMALLNISWYPRLQGGLVVYFTRIIITLGGRRFFGQRAQDRYCGCRQAALNLHIPSKSSVVSVDHAL